MRFNLLQLLTRKCNNEAEGRVIKGGGEGGDSEVDCHSTRRMAASRNFFRGEKIMYLAKVVAFLDHEKTYNYILHAQF